MQLRARRPACTRPCVPTACSRTTQVLQSNWFLGGPMAEKPPISWGSRAAEHSDDESARLQSLLRSDVLAKDLIQAIDLENNCGCARVWSWRRQMLQGVQSKQDRPTRQ